MLKSVSLLFIVLSSSIFWPKVVGSSFVASLSAAPGVTTSASGSGVFSLSSDGTVLDYVLTVSDISNVFMAHIHLSSNGDILVWLDPNPNNVTSGEEAGCIAILSGGPASACASLISGSFSGVLGRGNITAADLQGTTACAGCDDISFSQLVSDIQAGKAYANVHTTQNPTGEIQGTITSVTSDATPAGTSVALLVTLFVAAMGMVF